MDAEDRLAGVAPGSRGGSQLRVQLGRSKVQDPLRAVGDDPQSPARSGDFMQLDRRIRRTPTLVPPIPLVEFHHQPDEVELIEVDRPTLGQASSVDPPSRDECLRVIGRHRDRLVELVALDLQQVEQVQRRVLSLAEAPWL